MNASLFGPEAALDQRAPGAAPVPASVPADPSTPGPEAAFLPLRQRLARMLGRPQPLSEAELHQANLALTQLIEAPDPAHYLVEHHPILPAAVHPLLLTLLASAWADADTGLACALERLHRLLVQPPAPRPVD